MWNITARLSHGRTVHYQYPSRERARKARAALLTVPFVRTVSAPVK